MQRNRFFLFVTCMLLAVSANAETFNPIVDWQQIYDTGGASRFSDICLTGDGGVAFSGHGTDGTTDYHDAYFVRMDADGEIAVWETYGEDDHDHTKGITRTHDGFYVLAGYSHTPFGAPRHAMLMKVDEMGQVIWSHVYGEQGRDTNFAVVEVNPGRYFVAGDLSYAVDSLSAAHVMYMNEDGDFLWDHVFEEQGAEIRFYDCAMLDNNTLVAVGNKFVPGLRSYCYSACFDSTGTLLWQNQYEITDYHTLTTAVAAYPGSGFVMVGRGRQFDADPNNNDALVIQCDYDGIAKAHRIMGGAGDDEATDVKINGENEVVVSGRFGVPNTGKDLFLVKLNRVLQPIHTWILNMPNWQDARAFVYLNNDRIVMGADYMVEQPFNAMALHLKMSYSESDAHSDVVLERIQRSTNPIETRVYPNPFNQETQVTIKIAESTALKIDLYDVLGRRVQKITDKFYPAGIHPVHISGDGLPSGTYLLNISDGRQVQTKRIMLVK